MFVMFRVCDISLLARSCEGSLEPEGGRSDTLGLGCTGVRLLLVVTAFGGSAFLSGFLSKVGVLVCTLTIGGFCIEGRVFGGDIGLRLSNFWFITILARRRCCVLGEKE